MIMNLEDKPFACDEKNCFMTFTNEDHLNSHKKKHSMSFTLEINSKNIDTGKLLTNILNETSEISIFTTDIPADQTPTPTSFFRNCEEVGLFQDLQNVNPFEETFKKALESSENSTSKIESISDVSNDMLHTPHIFPNVEEPLHGKILDISDNEPLSVNLMEVPSLQVVSSENFLEKQADLRNKLKKALMKKDEIKNNQNLENNSSHTTGKLNINVNNNRKTKNAKTINSSNIERIREINRTAQMKCRVKKKMQMDIMTNDLLNLRKENLELKNENKRLRKNNIYLWKVIEDLGGNKESVMNKVKTFLENSLGELLPYFVQINVGP